MLLAEKNCSFKREFLTFIDWRLLLFNVHFVEVIHIKGQGGAGKAPGDSTGFHLWSWNSFLKGNFKGRKVEVMRSGRTMITFTIDEFVKSQFPILNMMISLCVCVCV